MGISGPSQLCAGFNLLGSSIPPRQDAAQQVRSGETRTQRVCAVSEPRGGCRVRDKAASARHLL